MQRKTKVQLRTSELGNSSMPAVLLGQGSAIVTDASARFVFSPALSEFSRTESSSMVHIIESQQYGAISLCFITLACGVTLIYASHGVFTCACIIAYITALSLMSVLIRRIYTDYSFQYPQFVTATDFLLTSSVGFALLLYRYFTEGKAIVVPRYRAFAFGIIPVGFANAFSTGFSNRGLLYCNAHFYEMMASQTLVVTACVGALMGRPLRTELYPPLIAITVGLLYLAAGELYFSAIGAFFIFVGVLMRATKVQLQGLLLGGTSSIQQLDPIELCAWSSAGCFVIMTAWSLAIEGLHPFARIGETRTMLAVFLSAMNACMYNITALFVLKALGPVAQQCVGQIKGAVACVVAVVSLGEVVTHQQVVGYSIVIMSIMWYSTIDMRLKAAEQSEKVERVQHP